MNAAILFAGLGVAEQSAPNPKQAPQPTESGSPFVEAEALLRQGSIKEAEKEILEELKLFPTSVEGYNLLGIVYGHEKDYPSSIEAFQRALKLNPNSVLTHNNLGNVYVAQEKFELAEKEFRAALRREPSNRDGNYNLGLVLLARDQPREAARYFLRVRPREAPVLFNLVRAYLRSGQTAAGLKLARELSAQGKDDVRTHFTLGVMLASEKQYSAGERELEKANALEPGTFEILYNLGQAYLRSAAYPKSELALDRALKLKPDSAECLTLLAQVYSDQKRAVDALELLVRAHKLAPKNTDVIFLMARLSMTQNYYEDAIPLLEEALQVAPQRADLRAALGESYFMSGKVEKAIDEFRTLIQVDPSARSFAFMGLCYRHLGRFDEAKKYFEEGLKHEPQNASCLYNLGYIENRQGNYARGEQYFQQALRSDPDFSDALLELASLRAAQKKYEDARTLLRRYVQIGHNPAPGYYKLAIVERSLHQMEAAERDMKVFQTLSKDSSSGPYPYQHLFDYLNKRGSLPAQAQAQLDLTELIEEAQKHPDQPQNLYMLAETYLKLGKPEEAKQTIAKLEQISGGDFRTQAGVGVLLARYHMLDEAVRHFRAALEANPASDDAKFDLANAYFHLANYPQALEILQQISSKGQQDDAVLALLGDIQAHLGRTSEAIKVFSDAMARSPDNDQHYLSLALTELREGNTEAAREILEKGLARIPDSGKILWGLGIVCVLEGKTDEAEKRLERAVDLLPEWSAGYSVLGVFYYQTGQASKARQVLNRYARSNPHGSLDVRRIENTLATAPADQSSGPLPLSPSGRNQFLQLALSLADRTL